MIEKTTAPVEPGNFTGVLPEFGRHGDVRRVFGLARAHLYVLAAQGKIRSVSLRAPGQKHGVRLWDMLSIREFILSAAANPPPPISRKGKPAVPQAAAA